MQVVTVETSAGQTRYYLANDDGIPVDPVLQYLRFRDNGGAARNTLRLTCIFMKHFLRTLKRESCVGRQLRLMIWPTFWPG